VGHVKLLDWKKRHNQFDINDPDKTGFCRYCKSFPETIFHLLENCTASQVSSARLLVRNAMNQVHMINMHDILKRRVDPHENDLIEQCLTQFFTELGLRL
jgi:hypothetical protein